MRFPVLFCAALVCLTTTVHAQDDEESGGFLVDFLEDNLSGDNRSIKVTGLEGALSGAATIEQITVSDDDGVWLTVNKAVLDWNRLALVRGRFSVNTLSAGEIILARAPTPTEAPAELPDAAATPFQLPELPVAIEIAELRVDKFDLAEPVIGRAAELSMQGDLNLADGTLATRLEILRLDKQTDTLKLTAGFANATDLISLDLNLVEAEGGLVSELLSIPDSPSIQLIAKGEGPVTDFTADISLASDDVQRLGGQVRLSSGPTPEAEDASSESIRFQADLGGNITPLLASDFQGFFGDDTQLKLLGRSGPDGRIAVENFGIQSDALDLTGSVDIAGSGLLERVLINGRIEPPNGAEVVLPIGDPRTSIQSALISAQLDTSKGNAWELKLTVDGLDRPDLTLARTEITADGTLDQQDKMHLKGDVSAVLRGIGFADASLMTAIGSQVRLNGNFEAIDENALKLNQFVLLGSDYSATIDASIDGLKSGFDVDGSASVQAGNLSRFSDLAGRDLSGAVSASITGKGSPLGGSFDFDLTATAQDPGIGIAQVDSLIAGKTDLNLQAARDETGLEIRAFTINGTALTADARGSVRNGETNLNFDAKLDDLARVLPDVSGPVTVSGDVVQNESGMTGKIRANGPNGSMAKVDGTMSPDGAVDVTYDALLEKVERFVPQLAGAVQAQGRAARTDEKWTVSSDIKGPTGSVAKLDGTIDPDGAIDVTYDAVLEKVERFVPQLAGAVRAQGRAERADENWTVDSDIKGPTGSTAKISGTMDPDGAIDVAYDATVTRIERFVPEFPGTFSAKGTAGRKDDVWQIETSAQGPASIAADIAGTVNQASLEANVTAKGQVQIGAANQFIKPNSVRGIALFDLALKGPAAVESLSGNITLSNASVALPDAKQTIDNLNANIGLSGGNADVSATAGFSAGGEIRVTGPIGLAPPFNAAIVVDILQLILTDNVAISSSANGRLNFNGDLTGNSSLAGEIQFGETNININTMAGSLGAAPIPPMTHTGESGAQRATRDWAGLIEDDKDSGASSNSDISLDIRLVAENKVFVRGRGLQAELGGDVIVRGTTSQIAPAGQIDLIRGTLAILGRRLKLTRGLVTLQGNLEPYMEFQATTSTSDGDATLEIAGPVTAPKVTVYSEPERPSEEALAMLIFGNQYSQLSPLKIAQMAASLAQLSGAGGGATETAREDLGVDTLDIGTDDDGNAEVGAGKYIADGVYTDISVNALGDTELNINLDVTDTLTLKGTVDNTGESALGIFFERDY